MQSFPYRRALNTSNMGTGPPLVTTEGITPFHFSTAVLRTSICRNSSNCAVICCFWSLSPSASALALVISCAASNFTRSKAFSASRACWTALTFASMASWKAGEN